MSDSTSLHGDAPEQGGLIAWWANNPVAANLLMLFIIAVGLLSTFSIKKTMMPEFELDFIVISMVYPGAAPEEVEQGIIYRIEEAISDLDGIERVESDSMESLARMTIEPAEGIDVNELINDVRNRVDAIHQFPESAEKPVIGRFEIPLEALLIQITGALDERSMKHLAEEIRRELLTLPQISTVDLRGTRDYEIAIEISEATLREYQLTLDDVAKTIARSSLDLPGGSVQTENGDILLRTRGQSYREADFAAIVLRAEENGERLLLADVATVRDGFVEGSGYSIFNGRYSVGVSIGALGEHDVMAAAKAAKQYVERKNADLPDGVRLVVWSDFSHYLDQRLSMMIKNLSMGAVVVFLVLALFLEIKLAMWVMVGIPICFLGSMALFGSSAVDGTLNLMSAFAFILVLGIVVDDAIIIGESAYHHREINGHSVKSIVAGAHEVAVPATFGVLTTIAAFAPTLFIDGVFRPFGQTIGFVVIFCLAFSLIESKWILPAHLAHSKPATRGWLFKIDLIQQRVNRALQRFVEEKYQVVVRIAVANRYTTVAFFVGLLILIVGFVAGGQVRVVFPPEMEAEAIVVELRMVDGTPRERTLEVMSQLAESLGQIDEDARAGSGDPQGLVRNLFAWGSGMTEGNMVAELVVSENRSTRTPDILQRWRESLADIPDADLLTFSADEGPDMGADLSFDFTHTDWNTLKLASGELEDRLRDYSGLYDVESTVSAVSDEYHVELKTEAEILGVSRLGLGSQVRHAFYGAEAQRIQRDREEIKVIVRFPESERRIATTLENMYVRSDLGEAIPFNTVANLEIRPGFNRITHIDFRRAAEITADVDTEVVEPSRVVADLEAEFIPSLIEKYPGLDYNLSGMSREEQLMARSMAIGLVLALFSVYALLAIPTRSYMQPLIIMGVIPFGIIGAVLGHMLFGYAVSMLSLMGIIALSGVVVNDSLIMVEYTNRQCAAGVARAEAVVLAGMRRFRAIVLTSLTTFCGLMPILLERSAQAQMIIPMAISLAFGILFATVITLLLVPCLYVIVDDMKVKLGFEPADDVLAENSSSAFQKV